MSQSEPPGSEVGSVAYQLGDLGKLPNMHLTVVVWKLSKDEVSKQSLTLIKHKLFSFLSEPAS